MEGSLATLGRPNIHLRADLSTSPSVIARSGISYGEDRTSALRLEILNTVDLYEALIRTEIIDSLFENTIVPKATQHQKLWAAAKARLKEGNIPGFDELYRRLLTTLEEEMSPRGIKTAVYNKIKSPDFISACAQAGISETRLRKRAKLVGLLMEATERVAFMHDLNLIAQAGPQTPFLAMQLLNRQREIPDYKIAALSADKRFADISHIFEIACLAFDEDITKPNWQVRLRNKLLLYRNTKREIAMKGSRAQVPEEYQKQHQALSSLFHEYYGISEDEVSVYAGSIDDFNQFLLSSVVQDPSLRMQLDRRGLEQDRVFDLDDLFLRIFGINHYGRDGTELSTYERSLVWQRLLLIIKYGEARRLWKQNLDMGNTFFDYQFHDLAQSPTAVETLGKDTKAERYQLVRDDYRNVIRIKIHDGDVDIDVSNITPEFISKQRKKSPVSVLRKFLERGGKHIDMSDFYARMIALDSEKFWQEFLQDPEKRKLYGTYKDEIIKAWAINTIKLICQYYQDQTAVAGYKYETLKPKGFGSMRELVPEQYQGSTASQVSNFNWYKFAHYVSDYRGDIVNQEELQFFPSVNDAILKKNDDARFNTERFFRSHKEGYFPLSYVLLGFGSEEAYDILMRQAFARRSGEIFP
ncbi:hypothetical protein MUP32_02185 [Candidatus Microgenomates bacterium]|nr:hypothetical protein [Candidatus Microgenomates bacterium]